MTRFDEALAPGGIKGSTNQQILLPQANCGSCLLTAESENRHLRRMKIYPLPNGNRLTIPGIPWESASTFRRVPSSPCFK